MRGKLRLEPELFAPELDPYDNGTGGGKIKTKEVDQELPLLAQR
jgi:hypothetical protein